jgi:hypothetical protein
VNPWASEKGADARRLVVAHLWAYPRLKPAGTGLIFKRADESATTGM